MVRYLSAGAIALGFLVLAACAPSAAPGGAAASKPAPAANAPAASAPAASAPAAPAAPAAPVVVRAGMIPSLASAPFLAGADLGVYERNGVDLQITPFSDTAAIMTQIASGNLDVGQVTIGSATLNAFSRGVDIFIAASGPVATTAVLVRKDLIDDGSFRGIADLRGRRVSINTRGVIHEYALHKILQWGGLTFDDVEIVLLPWPDQVTALSNRAVELGVVVEPLGSQAVARGAAVIWEPPDARGDPWFAPDVPGGLLMMNPRWAEANPRVATAVVKSYLEMARRVQGRNMFDDDAVLASLERWTKVPPDTVRRSLPSRWVLDGQLNTESLQDVQRYFIESGSTTYRQPLSIDALHNDTYLKAALAELGPAPGQ